MEGQVFKYIYIYYETLKKFTLKKHVSTTGD